MAESAAKRNVVIIGSGFAGVTLSRYLEARLPEDWDLFLLSRTNLITYSPLLPEVVGSSVLPGHVVAPLRRILRRTRIRMVEVTGIDFDEGYVEYTSPIVDRVRYDQLVIATGTDADMTRIPGMTSYGAPLKTVGDALYLRNRVIRNLEEATLTYDHERSRWLTSFVVVGGGFSGVEAAGEIHDLLAAAAPLFKRVSVGDCRVHIVHSGHQLLPEAEVGLARYAESIMVKRGIEVHLGSRVARVDDRGVTLTSGDAICSATVVSTVGSQPYRFVRQLPIADHEGRIPTTGTLQVQGRTDVWSLGDCALVRNATDGSTCPRTAQLAVRQAKLLGENLLAVVEGRPLKAFAYRAKGHVAGIGHRKAVAQIFGMRISGFPAWLLWRAWYLWSVPTMAMKIRLFFQWNWSLLFEKDVAMLGFERTRLEPQALGARHDSQQPRARTGSRSSFRTNE